MSPLRERSARQTRQAILDGARELFISKGVRLTSHDGPITAMAAGCCRTAPPVIISGGRDGTVRVWRDGYGTPVMPSLRLPESVQALALHGNVIITAAGADIAVHQPALPQPMR